MKDTIKKYRYNNISHLATDHLSDHHLVNINTHVPCLVPGSLWHRQAKGMCYLSHSSLFRAISTSRYLRWMKASAWKAGNNTWGKNPPDTSPAPALPSHCCEESKWGQSKQHRCTQATAFNFWLPAAPHNVTPLMKLFPDLLERWNMKTQAWAPSWKQKK